MIVDKSTFLAALRTAQIDVTLYPVHYIHGITFEDAQSLWTNTPQLQWVTAGVQSPLVVGLRPDLPELPTYKKDVRRTLCLAVDNQAILDTYFQGEGWLVHGPMSPQYPTIWMPLEEFPESVRELYEYHPDKARELLAKAGYPDGFEIDVLQRNVQTEIDQLAIIKEYWADIGVTLNMDIREYAVFASLMNNFAYNTGLMTYAPIANPLRAPYHLPGRTYNVARVDDPIGNELRGEVWKWEMRDPDDIIAASRKLSFYYMDQAYYLRLPAPFTYHFWWPWVKNYYGANSISYGSYLSFAKYIWIDQDLKKAMGYK